MTKNKKAYRIAIIIAALLLCGGACIAGAEWEEDPPEIGDTFVADGLEYEIMASAQAAVTGCEEDAVTECVIPSSTTFQGQTYAVTEISELAFSGLENLTSIELGSEIQTIGAYSFSECEALENLYIPAKVTEIAEGAFSGDEAICLKIDPENTTFTYTSGLLIKDGAIIYADPAMEQCTIPEQVKEILPYAFQGCDYLSEITIPSSVQRIGTGAFWDCYGIERVWIAENPALILEDDAFAQMWESGILYVDSPEQKQLVQAQQNAYPDSVEVVCTQNYEISYETDGGSFLTAPVDSGNSGQETELPEPVKEGNQFAGWYTDVAYSGDPQAATPEGNTENITYYAKWEPQEEGAEEIESEATSESRDTVNMEQMDEEPQQFSEAETEKNKLRVTADTEETEKTEPTAASVSQTQIESQTTQAVLPNEEASKPEKASEKEGKLEQYTQTQRNAAIPWWMWVVFALGLLCAVSGSGLLLQSRKKKKQNSGADTEER